MENDETTQDLELDATQTETEEVVEETTETNWEAEAKKWKAIAQRGKKHAEKAEAEPTLSSNESLSDELKLIARGLSDEEISQAKVISKGKEISLTEAIKDPLFLSFQKEAKEQQRKEDAKLGASKGSKQAEVKGFTPGMTEDEHKALWKEMNG